MDLIKIIGNIVRYLLMLYNAYFDSSFYLLILDLLILVSPIVFIVAIVFMAKDKLHKVLGDITGKKLKKGSGKKGSVKKGSAKENCPGNEYVINPVYITPEGNPEGDFSNSYYFSTSDEAIEFINADVDEFWASILNDTIINSITPPAVLNGHSLWIASHSYNRQ